MTRLALLITIGLAALSVAPSVAIAHTASDHRSQKFTFYYDATLPSSWEYPINLGFAQWDISGQCHDFRLGNQIQVARGGYDGQYGSYAYTSAAHDYVFFDWAEIWYVGTGTPPSNQADLWNMATHEAGHTLHLDHAGVATNQDTMYAYANYGEYNKRSLASQDEWRIRNIYPFGTCTM
jgi:hypothetical protein